MTADATAHTSGAESLTEFLQSEPALGITATSPGVTIATVDQGAIIGMAEVLLRRPGARFADMFATDTERLLLRTVIAFDHDASYLVLESPLESRTLPWVSDRVPAAFVEECELFEQYGLQPPEAHRLNRLALAPGPDDHRPEQDAVPSLDTHAAYTVGGHAFEFPVGPVRSAGTESLYYGLVTSGEEVVDLFLQTWHKYRGIERRLAGETPERALFLVERAEGLSAASTATAYCTAVEHAQRIPVPARTRGCRAICIELERLYNHAQAVAALCQSTGLFIGQAHAEMALEDLLRLNAAVAGHRYLFGAVHVGGGPDLDLVSLKAGVAAAVHRLVAVIEAILETNSCVDRLEATGIIESSDIATLGVVGPIARACGAALDVRRDHPGLATSVPEVSVPTHEAGDCLARLLVRRDELIESRRLLLALAEGQAPPAVTDDSASGWGLGTAESPRGETLVWVETGAERLTRVRLRTASARNWRVFDDAVRSQNVFTDVPIIEASFWLTVAGRVP